MAILRLKDGELGALLATPARVTIQFTGEELFDLLLALNTVGTLLENPRAALSTLALDLERSGHRDALYGRLVEAMRAANRAAGVVDHEA